MRARLPPQLYVITHREATAGRRPLVQAVEGALAALAYTGLRVAVQLRDKAACGRELLEQAHALRAVTARFSAALFVNDRVDVALAAGADGVHLGQAGLPTRAVRALGPQLSVGVSTHDPAEVRHAIAGGADFAVFGPVFDTPSKRGLLAPRGLSALSEAASLGLPLLALGGVDERTGASCLAAGAVGLAGIRLFLRDEPLSAGFVRMLQTLRDDGPASHTV